MNKLFAALISFTRLPLWRVVQVPSDAYSRVVDLWPLTGWLTGSVAAGALYLAGQLWPPVVAVVMALIVKTLFTGALHEDGLADYCDGMGAGGGREHILAVMKDSHIGTYGVLGLTLYYLLLSSSLCSMPIKTACIVMLAADPFAKMCAAQTVNMLPYARDAQTAKNRTVYRRMTPGAFAFCVLCGLLPLLPLWLVMPGLVWGAALSMTVCGILLLLTNRQIKGYTGDCCGALFLLTELGFVLGSLAALNS